MRVATWNVWWRFGGAWPARERAIRSVVADLRPDVLGLQETWRDADGSQPEALAALLGGHGVFVPVGVPPAPQPPEHKVQEGVEVGIGLVSRWPVRATVVHDLPAHVHAPARALHAVLDHPAGRCTCSSPAPSGSRRPRRPPTTARRRARSRTCSRTPRSTATCPCCSSAT